MNISNKRKNGFPAFTFLVSLYFKKNATKAQNLRFNVVTGSTE